jgi:hypothetical protein
VNVDAGRMEEVMVSLGPGFAVSVRLRDENDQPVEGAAITLSNEQGSKLSLPRPRFGGSGRGGQTAGNVYNLGSLTPGAYTLKADWDGATGRASFLVEMEGTLSLELKKD